MVKYDQVRAKDGRLINAIVLTSRPTSNESSADVNGKYLAIG